MSGFIRFLFDELVDIFFSLAFARKQTLRGELRYHRQQQKKRRMKISDAQYDELIARFTERTSQGERPGTVEGDDHGATTKQVSR